MPIGSNGDIHRFQRHTCRRRKRDGIRPETDRKQRQCTQYSKNVSSLHYHKQGIDNKGVLPISGLGITAPKIYKAKKFACRSLKGRGVDSGPRVIYAYWEDKDRIEFIEIYFKGDKENEDRDRILRN